MTSSAAPLLTDLLKAVSRSFYRTLRAMPGRVRPQFGLAYLLARATDTIADTDLLPVPQRLAALRDLRERILGTRLQPLDFSSLAQSQQGSSGLASPSKSPRAPREKKSGDGERVLLERIEEAITLLNEFGAEDQQRIREVLTTITGGQELDLRRFETGTASNPIALTSAAELDDYTYRVAGCVGEFWTRMCRAHLFPEAPLDDNALLRDGVRFGKGLQLVNILRDLPRDLRNGRCYLPGKELADVALTPRALLQADSVNRLRPVYDRWLQIADEHLAAGWQYTNALPRSAVRVRLACSWPVLIGTATLARLRRANPLDADRRIKIDRSEVKRIMVSTIVRYPFRRSWAGQFERARV